MAGLARAPPTLSPWSNLDGAIARSHVVLARMREEGFITEAQEREARRTSIRIRPYPGAAIRAAATPRSICASCFASGSAAIIRRTGRCGRRSCRRCRRRRNRPCARGWRDSVDPDLQAALVAIDPSTGDILALVGGRDFAQSQFNRASRSRRQPGSAFKPFLYAAALEHGYSPVSMIDGLASIRPQGPDEWTPRNADGEHARRADAARRALRVEQSRRHRAAAAARFAAGAAAGVGRRPARHAGRSIALAGDRAGRRRSELTAAYATFPNGGVAVAPRAIVRVLDADGGVALDNPGRRGARHLGADRVSDGVHALRRDRSRHRLVRAARGHRAFPSAAKPGRRTSSRTRGSSASRRTSSWASGSGSTSRSRSGATRTVRATRRRSGPTSCAAPARTRAPGRVRHSPEPEGGDAVPGVLLTTG